MQHRQKWHLPIWIFFQNQMTIKFGKPIVQWPQRKSNYNRQNNSQDNLKRLFSIDVYLPRREKLPLSAPIFISDIATAAPNNSNTMETVVDVGIPRVLKKSNNRISVIITAMKMNIISSK